MKRLSVLLIVPLVAAGCGGWKHSTDELQATKNRCVGADYDACSEIGHYARSQFYFSATSRKPKGDDVLIPSPVAGTEYPAVVDGQVTGAQPIID
ncbi:MAG: hypothetical protein ACU0BB_11010 [Paracoccaceae bacterium]|jgi:hypothetical protein